MCNVRYVRRDNEDVNKNETGKGRAKKQDREMDEGGKEGKAGYVKQAGGKKRSKGN